MKDGRNSRVIGVVAFLLLSSAGAAFGQCTNTVTADVVALDQPFFYNRLGAMNPAGMIFALAGDVEPVSGTALTAGNVRLKAYKRPRPLVLRVNAGDCLSINFTNLLNPVANTSADEPATRSASIHAMGMQLVGGAASDGSNVGRNTSSLVFPGGTALYTFYAEREGGFLLYSTGATTGGEGNGGSLAAGLFGAVNVEPPGTVWYRSQVTAADLDLAARCDSAGTCAPAATFTPKTFDGNGVLVSGGQPILNYDAVYPVGNPRAGLPILKMTTQGGKIVHSDLNAIVAGPGGTRIPTTAVNGYTYYNSTPQNPDRNEPFREFTVVFHDEIIAVQAFPEFRDPVLSFPLHSVRDGFAINYGTGGIGAEILANRKGLGPMKDCTECKYEEFFLTSWVVGDPAMVVDNPANSGVPATQAFYPDDPSNVHHSYISDHVKFRNIHAGPKEHHIFHLHAHQWVQSPDSPGSTYLDSQAIGPGASFTYEITYNGSGNRNKTVGDSIFHCHFYPHFAQGMWELWRSHDVFEDGSRMLPDAEIAAGTPIPALVPLPTRPMAPMPGTMGNPGYPFFAADATKPGHRPPSPPLDIAYDLNAGADGGLPRHIITGCPAGVTGPACFTHEETRLSFDKTLHAVAAVQVPESGTPLEQTAMAYHSVRQHPTFLPDGTAGATFTTNGMPRKVAGSTSPNPILRFGAQHGAPFADPCVDDAGAAVGSARTYKAAAIQLDITLNKAGWHFGQSRMLSLWDDAAAFLNKSKPPEPFFFRANTHDCIAYYHTNLVPNVYAQDDFQVRTPTDILGQHIHLVKFDVTSSDGSGNGYNYEDGTLSYGEIAERIAAINAGAWTPLAAADPIAPPRTTLACTTFGPAGVTQPCTRTTVQRWYADETMGFTGDKTLRTIFTHDHFGPSTHQQAGLYASLVIEPQGSTWFHNEKNVQLGTRSSDGGPTSWQARIIPSNPADSYREFMFQFADFQLAYRPDGTPVNPPARDEVPLTAVPPSLATVAANCPTNNGTVGPPRPCPEAISADDVGSMTVNYRNEPVALRVRNASTNQQETGQAGDLSFAYASIARPNSGLNRPDPYPPLTGGVQTGDPYTPLLRAYQNDRLQMRVQVGATEEGHNLSVHGMKWMHEPSWSDSGYRNSQMIGISEHFEMLVPGLGAIKGALPFNDYKYQVGSSSTDLWNGIWGILRSYNGGFGLQADLPTLPSNPDGKAPPADSKQFNGVCPAAAPVRKLSVTAITAQQALSGRTPAGTVVYNSRTNQGGILHDPTAILFVRSDDLDSTGLRLKASAPVEPLVLRANAGDCITLTLINKLPSVLPDRPGFFTLPMLVAGTPNAVDFNANQVAPSNQVGLHAQMLAYDVAGSDGANVGSNPVQTAGPGGTAKYKWYAGDVHFDTGTGLWTATPMEFGALNLIPADPIKHPSKGAIGALIIEPAGSCSGPAATGPGNDPCGEDALSRASATITHKEANGNRDTFREFVLLYQNSVNLQRGTGLMADPAVPRVAEAEDPEDSGNKAFNFRTEPMWKRMGYEPNRPLSGPGGTREIDFTNALSNSLAGVGGDPQTPVFTAVSGQAARFRVVHPGGVGRNNVFNLHGDGWQEQPYFSNSTRMGYNPGGICNGGDQNTPCNTMSEYKGSQYGIGPTSHFNFILRSAGGRGNATGDFLYRDQPSFDFDGGLWGIFRVCATAPCP